MKVGIPSEIKNHEYRVAITPAGVLELVRHGHEVVIETGAGVGSSIPNDDYVAAGATILPTADEVWAAADMILKVKEPIAAEYHRMREGQLLFTYLHLAADRPLTEELARRKVTAIAYETVELADGSLPLLAPRLRSVPMPSFYQIDFVCQAHDLAPPADWAAFQDALQPWSTLPADVASVLADPSQCANRRAAAPPLVESDDQAPLDRARWLRRANAR